VAQSQVRCRATNPWSAWERRNRCAAAQPTPGAPGRGATGALPRNHPLRRASMGGATGALPRNHSERHVRVCVLRKRHDARATKNCFHVGSATVIMVPTHGGWADLPLTQGRHVHWIPAPT
jgi:hypothetical protein